jgi:hypothetical protein
MAINIENVSAITGINQVGNSYQRKSAVPLEYYSLFNSLEEAKMYAQDNPVAYVGQIVTVVDKENIITHYSIINTNGALEEVGKILEWTNWD